MDILIGLAVLSVAAIGWFYGNLFVCVFLSLAGVLAASAAGGAQVGPTIIFVLLVIWTPRIYRLLAQKEKRQRY